MALKRVGSSPSELANLLPVPDAAALPRHGDIDNTLHSNSPHRPADERAGLHTFVRHLMHIICVCLTIFWLWEHGFVASWTSQSLAGASVFFLALNAILGYRMKIKLKLFKEAEYSDYVTRLSQVTTHEKLRPIWIERNPRAV